MRNCKWQFNVEFFLNKYQYRATYESGTLKYAYHLVSNQQLTQKIEIQDKQFVALGPFETEQPFEETPLIKVLLSGEYVKAECIL